MHRLPEPVLRRDLGPLLRRESCQRLRTAEQLEGPTRQGTRQREVQGQGHEQHGGVLETPAREVAPAAAFRAGLGG